MSTVNGSNIQNAGTSLYADVNGGNVAPGTNVIIYTLNQTGGTRNQDVCAFLLCFFFFLPNTYPFSGDSSLLMRAPICMRFKVSLPANMPTSIRAHLSVTLRLYLHSQIDFITWKYVGSSGEDQSHLHPLAN